jgi:hypothetical protein
MTWQPEDSVSHELRLAQAELRHMELGMDLLTLDQRLAVLPSREALEKKIRSLELVLDT